MAAEVKAEPNGVSVNTFKEKILGFDIHFYVLRMQQSFFLWIGTEPNLETLVVAMQTRFVSLLLSIASSFHSPSFIEKMYAWFYPLYSI